MTEFDRDPAIGIEMNGRVWDGAQWVPKPPDQPRQPDPGNWPPPPLGSGFTPAFGGPRPSAAFVGFASPYYAYGLTKRASDDIHFIARFMKVMIWVRIVIFVLSLIPLLLMLPAILAALGGLLSLMLNR